MKRYKSIYTEKFLHAFKHAGEYVEVFEDPTRQEYAGLESYKTHNEVKALIDKDVLIVWSSYDYHEDIVHEMGWTGRDLVAIEIAGVLEQDCIVTITVTAAILSDLNMDQREDVINNNKTLKHFFKSITIV